MSFFNAANSTPQQSGGLFGSSQTQGGGLFGGGGAQQQQQQSGGLFGSNASQQQQPGGLFGSSTTQQQQPGGLFGSNTTQQQQSGGLFGSNTAQQQQPGGLFGSNAAPQQQQQSGGLFGSSSTSQTQSGGLFGSSNSSGSTFGSSSGGGGLFGSSTQQQQPSSGLFGSSNNNSSGGLFGSSGGTTSSGGLFGSQPQGGGGGLFGSSQPQQGGSLFGSGGGGLFGGQQQQQFQQQQQQQQAPTVSPWWYRELMTIQASYRSGPGCRFQTMLYEVLGIAPDLLVHSGAVGLSHIDNVKAQRKRLMLQTYPWIDEREWQRAEDKNPDPINWIPSPVIGITALHDRAGLQAQYVRAQLDMLIGPNGSNKSQSTSQPKEGANNLQLATIKESEESKEDYSDSDHGHHWLRLEVSEPQEEIERCRHEHIRLKQRLIRALGRLERLQCAHLRGGRMDSEVEFEQRLNRVANALSDPRGCRAQLTSIVTQMELEDYQNSKVSPISELRPNGGFSEQDQIAIFNFLELQREGIDNLMKIVKRDTRDLEIIKRRMGEV